MLSEEYCGEGVVIIEELKDFAAIFSCATYVPLDDSLLMTHLILFSSQRNFTVFPLTAFFPFLFIYFPLTTQTISKKR